MTYQIVVRIKWNLDILCTVWVLICNYFIITNSIPYDSEPILVYRQEHNSQRQSSYLFSFAHANMCNPMEAASNISSHKEWNHAHPHPALIRVWTELVGSAKIHRYSSSL